VAVVVPALVLAAVPLEPELQPAAIAPLARTAMSAAARTLPLNLPSDLIRHLLLSGNRLHRLVNGKFSCASPVGGAG
jgi:hypothetical protein